MTTTETEVRARESLDRMLAWLRFCPRLYMLKATAALVPYENLADLRRRRLTKNGIQAVEDLKTRILVEQDSN